MCCQQRTYYKSIHIFEHDVIQRWKKFTHHTEENKQKPKMQDAETQTNVDASTQTRSRKEKNHVIDLKDTTRQYKITPIKTSGRRGKKFVKSWKRTPCVICGKEGHVLYSCPRRAKKNLERDIDHQLELDTKRLVYKK